MLSPNARYTLGRARAPIASTAGTATSPPVWGAVTPTGVPAVKYAGSDSGRSVACCAPAATPSTVNRPPVPDVAACPPIETVTPGRRTTSVASRRPFPFSS